MKNTAKIFVVLIDTYNNICYILFKYILIKTIGIKQKEDSYVCWKRKRIEIFTGDLQ